MLEEQISKDYVKAMKDRDTLRSSTLSFLRAQMKNVIIEKKVDKLKDEEVIAVIKKQIKQRQDSIAQFELGGRQDLVSKEAAELAILKSYLPEEMSEQELERCVAGAIQEAQAGSMKDMGKVMKIMAEKVKGKADNKLVSELVKKALSQV
ncbi:MAG: GatB/YqeY domain-containing protein [Candidatus Omnitrophica bacterium]|nr:GatB/YqeY domain-containing protein [Candidatus Omnitrophota bacterium]